VHGQLDCGRQELAPELGLQALRQTYLRTHECDRAAQVALRRLAVRSAARGAGQGREVGGRLARAQQSAKKCQRAALRLWARRVGSEAREPRRRELWATGGERQGCGERNESCWPEMTHRQVKQAAQPRSGRPPASGASVAAELARDLGRRAHSAGSTGSAGRPRPDKTSLGNTTPPARSPLLASKHPLAPVSEAVSSLADAISEKGERQPPSLLRGGRTQERRRIDLAARVISPDAAQAQSRRFEAPISAQRALY
jgi:hypothetical protein